MQRLLSWILCAWLLLPAAAAQSPASETEPPPSPPPQTKPARPNIIIICTQGLGPGDLSCLGQQRCRTPAIDALAAQGILFTQAYSASPDPAAAFSALLSSIHTGHSSIRLTRSHDSAQGLVSWPENTATWPQAFAANRYTNAFFGTWLNGGFATPGSPLKQGFPQFFGQLTWEDACQHYPSKVWQNDQQLELNQQLPDLHQTLPDPTLRAEDPKAYSSYKGSLFLPDLLEERLLAFLRAQTPDTPFLIFYNSQLPHPALQVPAAALARHAGRHPDAPYLGDSGFLPQQYPRAARAAMIEMLDAQVGAIVQALTATGRLEDSIIIFTSLTAPLDAGGIDLAYFQSSRGLRQANGSLFEGSLRIPLIIRPGANTSLTKLTSPQTAVRLAAPVWLPDLGPTLLRSAGLTAPTLSDGLDLGGLIRGQATLPPRDFYFETAYARALVSGQLKFMEHAPFLKDASRAFYDLASDPAEASDLAAQRADELKQLLERAKAQHVIIPGSPSPFD